MMKHEVIVLTSPSGGEFRLLSGEYLGEEHVGKENEDGGCNHGIG